jgi:hypothetical protein
MPPGMLLKSLYFPMAEERVTDFASAKESTQFKINQQNRANCGTLPLRLIPRLCSAASGESLI